MCERRDLIPAESVDGREIAVVSRVNAWNTERSGSGGTRIQDGGGEGLEGAGGEARNGGTWTSGTREATIKLNVWGTYSQMKMYKLN